MPAGPPGNSDGELAVRCMDGVRRTSRRCVQRGTKGSMAPRATSPTRTGLLAGQRPRRPVDELETHTFTSSTDDLSPLRSSGTVVPGDERDLLISTQATPLTKPPRSSASSLSVPRVSIGIGTRRTPTSSSWPIPRATASASSIRATADTRVGGFGALLTGGKRCGGGSRSSRSASDRRSTSPIVTISESS